MPVPLQGVCIGLSEVMASAGKSQLLSFMDELIPTIRTALCDRYFFYLFTVMFNVHTKYFGFCYLLSDGDWFLFL